MEFQNANNENLTADDDDFFCSENDLYAASIPASIKDESTYQEKHNRFLLKRKSEEKVVLLNHDEIIKELNKLKEDYYRDNGKNVFFKNKQKIEIAKKICNNFDIFFLFKKTIFRIKDTNIVFIDYKFFKIYMNETIYEQLIDYAKYLFDKTIEMYGSFIIQIDADTITPSAVERYKDIVIKFNDKCKHTEYVNHLQKWVIYNVPTFVDSVVNILVAIIHPDIINRLERYSKKESAIILKDFYERELIVI
jgi:hypothetical protein